MQELAWLVTALFLCGLCLAARLLNTFTRHFLSGDLRNHFRETVASFFICALSLEKASVRWHYGDFAFLVISVVTDTYYTFAFPHASGNICETLNLWLKKKLLSGQAFMRVLLQIMGGVAGLQFARMIWIWGFTDFHYDRYTNFVSGSCKGDITVTLATAFALEFGASLISVYVSQQQMKVFGNTAVCVKSLLLTVMVLCGIDMTGMYFNPMNATNNNFGCHSVSLPALILVYWLGPILAYILWHVVSESMRTTQAPSEPVTTQLGAPSILNGRVPESHAADADLKKSMNGDATKRKAKRRYYVNGDRMSSLRRR